ncbi:hypothetical protein SAMN05192561_1066 [Halopenitus malekzadehii]|uniref:Uncharacterized protein n=1 Tax=Halopenitus malekzadehii TaxID=1267564 RepID=A0A1H6IZN3_9EURY|nr:hypothetical protein SAMN05192561_1066 [Halopenitus malekzadehii]
MSKRTNSLGMSVLVDLDRTDRDNHIDRNDHIDRDNHTDRNDRTDRDRS